MRVLSCWIVAAALLAAPVARAEDWSGTWFLEAEKLVVDLRQDVDGGLSGTVSHRGARYGIRGKVEADLAKGIYHNDLAGIFFEARRVEGGLEFVILESSPDSAEYERHPHLLVRQVAAPVVAGGRSGRMVQHPAGFGMWVPDDWRSEESGPMLRLLPPAQDEEVLGKSEVVLVMAIDLGSASENPKPDDPRMVHFLDSMAQNISSALRRSAAPTGIDRGRQRGTFLEWTTDVVDPTSRRSHGWVTVLGQKAVALMAAGPGVDLRHRTGDLRLVFVSLGFDDSGTEPAMMRTWSLQSTARLEADPGGTRDWARDRAAPDQGCRLTLNADGTFQRVRSGGAGEDHGRWATGTGALHLIHEDAREVYEYSIEPEEDGIKLRLQVGERGEIWIRESLNPEPDPRS
ncbi:MAG: hypothetical protein ABIK09_20555 [Pseudomonadota bacterium]